MGERTIREAAQSDAEAWLELRCALWPDGADEHAQEIAGFFAGLLEEPQAVLLCEDERELLGIAELSIREDVPGLEGRKACYIEGLYVKPEARWSGVGRALVRGSREWARTMKCEGFASDRAERIVVDWGFGMEERKGKSKTNSRVSI